MLDIQQLRSNLDAVAEGLAKRGKPIDFSEFKALETERKTLQPARRNCRRSVIRCPSRSACLKGQGKDASEVMAQVGALGDELKASEARLGELLDKVQRHSRRAAEYPRRIGAGRQRRNGNVEVKRWGTPRVFDFPVKDHTDVGEALGQLDFATAAKISGARFSLLKGGLARLHRALAQFMLDTHTAEHGYTEVYAPYLVNAASLHGTGQLPKFEEDLFKVLRGDQDPLYLIPTAEVPVTNIVRDEILAAEALPLKFVCHTPCFRSEAGSGGRDVRGMIRQHQFDKVELVQIVHPEKSAEAHEELTRQAEIILESWNCPTAVWRCVPATWAFPPPRPTTSKSGCRRRTPTARFRPAPTSAPSRRVACRRVSATTRTSPNWCTR
jgi:seryl-tRNA synthetase